MIVIGVRPHIERQGVHLDRFEGWLDGELLVISRRVRLDAARELVKRGYDSDTLLTTRREGKDFCSWIPAPIGELAKWTVTESDGDGLRRKAWKPYEDRLQTADSSCPIESHRDVAAE